MVKYKKDHEVKIRVTEIMLRKLTAICSVTGKTKTAVIEDLILKEFKKNKQYEDRYYLNSEVKI